jgi:hypothetical protein
MSLRISPAASVSLLASSLPLGRSDTPSSTVRCERVRECGGLSFLLVQRRTSPGSITGRLLVDPRSLAARDALQLPLARESRLECGEHASMSKNALPAAVRACPRLLGGLSVTLALSSCTRS